MEVKSVTRQRFEIKDPKLRKRFDIRMALALIKNQYIKGQLERDVYEFAAKEAQKMLDNLKEQ